MRLILPEYLAIAIGTAKPAMITLQCWCEPAFFRSFLAALLDRSQRSLRFLGGAG